MKTWTCTEIRVTFKLDGKEAFNQYLLFETKDAEMYLEFERGTDEIDPSGNTFVIIASAQFVKVDTNTTITYQLFKNANNGFSLGAVA